LLAAGLNLAWSLITYLIVPVLLFEDCGVFGSLHRSEQLFRSHWGEQVAGSFGFGLLSTVLSIPAVFLALDLLAVDPVAGIILGAVYLLILATVTLRGERSLHRGALPVRDGGRGAAGLLGGCDRRRAGRPPEHCQTGALGRLLTKGRRMPFDTKAD
jgi:hypothetical protein